MLAIVSWCFGPLPNPVWSATPGSFSIHFLVCGQSSVHVGAMLSHPGMTPLSRTRPQSLDDGNCQFRSVASQFFGDQDRHAEVRAAACDHIAGNRGYYEIFFEGRAEFDRFLATMRRDRTWGNELTLRAITDYFGESFGTYLGSSVSWKCHGPLISPPLGAGGRLLVLDVQE